MRIGAHVSASGGLSKAIERGASLGAETIQIFASSPQQWAFKPHPEKEIEQFKAKAKETSISPVFIHGVYLVNLATDNPDYLTKGLASLTFTLDAANKIGASGVIFHVGSHRGGSFDGVLDQVVECFHKVLDGAPGNAWLIIENNAGSGQNIGAPFWQIGRILKEVGGDRVRVCLDTAHCLASGYDVTSKEGLDAAMEEFDREIGLENLVAVHANDSKAPLNSGVDRHENIGHGYIGAEGFRLIMGHPAFRDLPFLLEVPGFEGKGPDKENVEALLSIRKSLGLSAD